MIRAHKITLKLNNKQRTHLAKASGCARFAYNWALSQWKKDFEAGEKPNEAKLRKKLNAIKASEFAWMSEVSKCAPQMAIQDLGKAFKNFFEKRASYPNFKRKGIHDSFTLSNDHFRVVGKKLRIPHLGFVKMREELRYSGKPLWATISRSAGSWQVAISVEMPDLPKVIPSSQSVVGIDLGISRLATLSNGEIFANPNALETSLKKLKRLSRALSRKKIASRNRLKASRKLAILYKNIANLRRDSLHKFTTSVVKRHQIVCLEDLNVKGMTKNKHLARRLSDSSFGEIRRQFEYKGKERGVEILFVGTFFPSSKLCSHCQTMKSDLTLKDRNWQCRTCKQHHDRDINATINLRNFAVSYTVGSAASKACGEESSGSHLTVTCETILDEAGMKHQGTT